MGEALTLNQIEISLIVAGFMGFGLRYFFDMDLAKVIGVLMMAPAAAWIAQTTYILIVPRLGWTGWVGIILMEGVIFSGVRGVPAFLIALILGSYALWLRLFMLYGGLSPLAIGANRTASVSLLLVSLLFVVWGLVDFWREDVFLG